MTEPTARGRAERINEIIRGELVAENTHVYSGNDYSLATCIVKLQDELAAMSDRLAVLEALHPPAAHHEGAK